MSFTVRPGRIPSPPKIGGDESIVVLGVFAAQDRNRIAQKPAMRSIIGTFVYAKCNLGCSEYEKSTVYFTLELCALIMVANVAQASE